MATYHRFENDLFDRIVEDLAARTDVLLVLLPRTPAQEIASEHLRGPSCLIPEKALDALSLAYYSDLVIGAGGTMNREAAVLGTPTYTVFQGNLGSVDRLLADAGRMVLVERAEQIVIEKRAKARTGLADTGASLTSHVVSAALAAAGG
jgi:predicted glycosyltransferase